MSPKRKLIARARRWGAIAAATAAALPGQTAGAAAFGLGAIPPSRPLAVFDNTSYPNVNLEAFGLVRSAVVYETQAQTEAIAAGRLPDRASFERSVAAKATVPGPVVLDYEDLYLTGSTTTATWHLQVLTALAGWAHDAAPRKAIGFYGLLDHTAAIYVPLARQLAPLENAFFPSMYTFDDDRFKWQQRLQDDVSLANRIAPSKPVYPYLWPQYHQGTPRAGQFVDSAYWAFELATARNLAAGLVIWSPHQPNESAGWVDATKLFMRSL